MSEDVKGVFVRLPLSDKQKLVLWDKVGDDAFDEAILAIGTPVTGDELDVVAYDNLASGHLSRVKPVGPNINLIRQSDALAKLAEKDAEIARLNEELRGFRAGLSELVAKEVAALKGGAA